MDALTQQIREFAAAQGADLVGIAPVETYSDFYAEVQRRIEETGATRADFMIAADDTTFFERLSDARNTLPTARAIVLLGVNAYDEEAMFQNARGELRGKTPRVYSYYPVVTQVAEALTVFLRGQGYSAVQGQDVPLKHVADRINLGSYGKNGVLLTSRYGSYVGLRDVVTDAPLRADEFPRVAFCQDCDLCLRACPTGALYAPYKIDPRLCLNPISRREDPIPPRLRREMRNWIQGCDICQEVCPVNRRLVPRKRDPRSGFDPVHHSSHRDLGGLEKSPCLLELLDSGYPRIIRRNAAIALANTGHDKHQAVEALERQLDQVDPELQGYLLWAIEALS